MKIAIGLKKTFPRDTWRDLATTRKPTQPIVFSVHTSFLQLRESDLYAQLFRARCLKSVFLTNLHRGRNSGAHRPALILLFAKKFFRAVVATALCRRV